MESRARPDSWHRHAPLPEPLSAGQSLPPLRDTNKFAHTESHGVVPKPVVETPWLEGRVEDRCEESCLPGDRQWPESLSSKPDRLVESRPVEIPSSDCFRGSTPSLRVLPNKRPCASPRPTGYPESI